MSGHSVYVASVFALQMCLSSNEKLLLTSGMVRIANGFYCSSRFETNSYIYGGTRSDPLSIHVLQIKPLDDVNEKERSQGEAR